jgi:hypothetical protein
MGMTGPLIDPEIEARVRADERVQRSEQEMRDRAHEMGLDGFVEWTLTHEGRVAYSRHSMVRLRVAIEIRKAH